MDQLDEEVADQTKERSELSLEEQESVTVQAELSSVLEESVESLSAAVGGWRSELARSSERSSRLEATIASLSAAMETWKTDMARTGARAEERLLRALEILESRMAQNQAIASEIRESLGSSAAWLTRAMEEWKAEIRYGSGLTEVRLISAIESLEGRVGQVQETENQTRDQLENSTAEVGRNLEARLDTVKAVQDETREWLEAAATAMGNDAQSALGRLRELGSSIDAFRGEMRQNAADDRALASESHALQVNRINEVVRTVSEAQSASASDRSETRAQVGAIKDAVTEAIATGLSEAQGANTAVLSEIRSGMSSLKEAVSQAVATELEAISSFKGSVEEWKSELGTSTTKTETRLLRALEALEEGISETRKLGSETQAAVDRASGHSEEMVAKGLSELEGKILNTVEERLSLLTATMQEWHGEVGKAATSTETKLVRSLEALESGIARLSGTQQEGAERQEQIESSVMALTQSIDDWRNKGRESAGRTKDRISQSIDALENRILESKEEEADYRDLVRRELVALTDAVENLGSSGRDHTTVMRGLEELDEGLLRNRDDLSHLTETFEAQFEIFESRVGEAVAARIDELERNIQERNKALATLFLGPRADSESLASLEAPGPTRKKTVTPAPEAIEPRPSQQARRRR
jgi:uncharacterized protein YjbJ (UPF0337 family)